MGRLYVSRVDGTANGGLAWSSDGERRSRRVESKGQHSYNVADGTGTTRIKPEATPHCHPTAAALLLLGRCRCWLQLAAAWLPSAARSLRPLHAAPNSCRLRASTLGLSLQARCGAPRLCRTSASRATSTPFSRPSHCRPHGTHPAPSAKRSISSSRVRVSRIQPEAPHNCCCLAATRIQPEAPRDCCCLADGC